jgi:hypothetical protein
MKKYLVIAALSALTVTVSVAPAWGADAATDATQQKLQLVSIPAMRQSIAHAAGYEVKGIELKHTAHLLTVKVVNSKQNESAPVDRETEAMMMALAMEGEMRGKTEFNAVASIHIDYISRVGAKETTVQVFDFFRSPSNAFVLHRS